MKRFKFAASETSFPCWGSLAIQMAGQAGFSGMQIADAGGYLQPHPGNNGYVEYERYDLDLRRKDSFPLTLRQVQEDYLEAAATYKIELFSIYLYTLAHQGFIKYSKHTPQGAQCVESMEHAVQAASQMHIPSITISARGLFGVAQTEYALSMLGYAIKLAEDNGIQIVVSVDPYPETRRRFQDAFGEKLKLEIDTFTHIMQRSSTAETLIDRLDVNSIGYFRLSDALVDPEGFVTLETANMTLLGEGKTGFSENAQTILKSGYAGWILSGTPYYHPDLQSPGDDYVSLAQKDVLSLHTAFPETL